MTDNLLSFDQRAARDAADAEAHAAAQQAEVRRLTGTPSTSADLIALAVAWADAVRRLPVVALGDIQPIDGIAHQLRAIAETTPVADTAGPWTSIKAHYAMRQQEQRSTAP